VGIAILGAIGRVADVLVITCLAVGYLLGWSVTRSAWLYARHRQAGLRRERDMLSRALPPDAALPSVLIQIPTFNEGALIWRAIATITAFDWPRDRLQVQVLDDSNDESADITRAAVDEFRRLGHRVALVRRTTRSGFKAGALKAGLERSNEPFVAMFDVDYVPQPDFLRQCMRPLLADPALAFVQARCDFLNGMTNKVTRAQQIMLDSHFGAEQATRSWTNQVLPFNGTCGIWRRAAIETCGGWQGDTLTEDLDLSYRAQIAGWRAAYLVSVAVPGELPVTIGAWNSQQVRWNKGFAQTARKLLPVILRGKSTWKRKVEAVLHFGGCFSGILGAATMILCGADWALGTMSYAIVLPLLGIGLLKGCVDLLTLPIASRNLLQSMLSVRPPTTLRQTCARVLAANAMYEGYKLMMGFKILQAFGGGKVSFERTPKTGAVACELTDKTPRLGS
jgi:cellulose synthase/poly-beta-1,6-N-acetylglucosamine synthase-like glycosyltransferase